LVTKTNDWPSRVIISGNLDPTYWYVLAYIPSLIINDKGISWKPKEVQVPQKRTTRFSSRLNLPYLNSCRLLCSWNVDERRSFIVYFIHNSGSATLESLFSQASKLYCRGNSLLNPVMWFPNPSLPSNLRYCLIIIQLTISKK
jgi:hypothetical protein